MNTRYPTGKYPPLIENAGVMLLDNLISDKLLTDLQSECFRSRQHAVEQRQFEDNNSGYRKGKPSRWLLSAEGGPLQSGFYHNDALSETISHLCGRACCPTGSLGSYSYYDSPGHFLGLHRDIPGCDAVLITCLYRDEKMTQSGALRVHYKDYATRLESIPSKQPCYRDIYLKAGESALLLGGWIPHEVLPASESFQRYISVLCFRMAANH